MVAQDFLMGMVNKGGVFIVGAEIKSIQQVSISIGNGETVDAATINAVVMANTVIIFNGFIHAAFNATLAPQLKLTDTTTVTATRGAANVNPTTVKATVIEFDTDSIVGVQRGTVDFAIDDYSKTATINAVDLDKSVILFLGSLEITNPAFEDWNIHMVLTDTTTVTASRATDNSVLSTSFEVLEFL